MALASSNPPHVSATQVFLAAVYRLANWSDAKIAISDDPPDISAITAVFSWPDHSTDFCPLKLLFDQVKLNQSQPLANHYWLPQAIADESPNVPYPVSEVGPKDLSALKAELRKSLSSLKPQDFQNLSLLSLLVEKYGSFISLGETAIAFSDQVKVTAALAACLSHNSDGDTLALVGADLSGIQSFIYTIASVGALKSLRARSFFLELITEEVTYQILETLSLPRSNVIYSGGGKVYILSSDGSDLVTQLASLSTQFNQWFLESYQGKLSLNLTHVSLPLADLKNQKFSSHWERLNRQLNHLKGQKFSPQLQSFLAIKEAHEPCKVCHRDDISKLAPLNPDDPDDSPEACPTCRMLFRLGSRLFGTTVLVRSRQPIRANATYSLSMFNETQKVYYHFYPKNPKDFAYNESILLINNWTIKNYRSTTGHPITPLLLGNYGRSKPEVETWGGQGFMTAEGFAQESRGIPRVGYLRMDVDRLGQIFAQGFAESNPSLLKLASLSRLLTYFFKVYLNSLAEKRSYNTSPNGDRFYQLTDSQRQDLLFIYAGGDDVFVSGAWDQVVEFSNDLYQAFRAYTGHNPSITLSAGLELYPPKFPLYKAADAAGQAEEKAKQAGRDRLCLFGEVFPWSEWLGKSSEFNTSPLQGILPLVKILDADLDQYYSRNFVGDLLQVSNKQRQLADEAAKHPNYPCEVEEVRTYFHLPMMAY